jgi:hypothetical protein
MAIDLGPDGLTLGSTTINDWDDVGGGKLLQIARVESSTALSSSNNIPADTSTPTSSEGVQMLSLSFTPTSASSDLYLFFTLYGDEDTNAADSIAYTVFKGSTLIGMGYQAITGESPNNWNMASFSVKHSPASTSAQTYSVRGGTNGGTFESLNTKLYVNNSTYGSNNKNSMTIMEIG